MQFKQLMSFYLYKKYLKLFANVWFSLVLRSYCVIHFDFLSDLMMIETTDIFEVLIKFFSVYKHLLIFLMNMVQKRSIL